MRKTLSAVDPAPAVAGMQATGVLASILPGADPMFLAPLVHLETEANIQPDPIRRFAVLGEEGIVERMRLKKSETKDLDLLRTLIGDPMETAAVAWRHGVDIAWSAQLLRQAMSGQPLSPRASDRITLGSNAKFPIAASDLIDRVQGKELGDALRRAEQIWIESDFNLSKAVLIETVFKEG